MGNNEERVMQYCFENNFEKFRDFCIRHGYTTDTTVLVPINMIKVANTKIIKAKLYKDIINEQDSIINLHKIKYNALHKEVETLQYNLNNSNKTNDNLNKSIERIKRKNRYLVSGGAVCAIAFIVCLLVK